MTYICVINGHSLTESFLLKLELVYTCKEAVKAETQAIHVAALNRGAHSHSVIYLLGNVTLLLSTDSCICFYVYYLELRLRHLQC